MYLATAEEIVSAVLMAERGKKQFPICFAHLIQVLRDKPIKQILAKPEKSARIARWAIELGEYDIEFRGRNSNKGQILADFLAETPLPEIREAKNEEVKRKEPKPENAWKLFTNRASSSDGSGAEYEALLAALRIAKEMEIRELIIFVDSQLVANQVKGLFVAKQPTIKQYLEKTMDLLSSFHSYSIEHIKREQNKKANAFSKQASMAFSKLAKEVLVEVIQNKSIEEKGVMDIVQEERDNWMTPIREYLKSGTLPDDPQKARKLHIKAPLYRIIKEKLYRRSYLSPWLRCVGPIQAKNIIKEVHEGSCGMHSGPRKQKQEMTSIMSAWPFPQWGIDIVGPLLTAPGGARFLVEWSEDWEVHAKHGSMSYRKFYGHTEQRLNPAMEKLPLAWSTAQKPSSP
ncbi:reverse transcriptase domain-containing protein [Tanacetum coccineum]